MALLRELLRDGAKALRLPDMPASHRLVLVVPPDAFVLYDGDQRLHVVWLGAAEWNDARWEAA